MEEGIGPRVPRSKGSKVPGSKGPRYLKLKFRYELDSKEGPSCSNLFLLESWGALVRLIDASISTHELTIGV